MAGNGGGGAWKVAYADFVTAMMALFMVLWISAQDESIVVATSQYFQSPRKALLDGAAGILTVERMRPMRMDKVGDKGDEGTGLVDQRKIDTQYLQEIADNLYRLLNLDEVAGERPIEIQVTSDGLKVTLYDRGSRPLFKDDSAEFTEWGGFVMETLAWIIDRHQFNVVIEGHTRKGAAMTNPDYSAWELSSDFANASRRSLTHYAVNPALIERVSGFSDTKPLPGLDAADASNQRVTLSMSLRRRAAAPSASGTAGAAQPPPAENGKAR